MSPLRLGLAAILAALPACSQKSDHPPVLTTGSSGGGVGGGGAAADSAVDDSGGSGDAGADGAEASACLSPCNGCCDQSNVCQPGDASTACGLNGSLCQNCAQLQLSTCGPTGSCL